MTPAFLALGARRLEYALDPAPSGAPTLVFLHEGLGSLSTWRDFPARLGKRAGCGALVYSRFGHGQSDPELAPRGPDFFAREARETLPAIRAALGLDDVVLVGHSDGGTIVLCHLAAGFAARGAIVAAPHTFDEEMTWRAIEDQRAAWRNGVLKARLARHHRDPDATFAAWADHWLDEKFRGWSIVPELRHITAPLLVFQGESDIYGSMRQVDEIAAHAGGPVELQKLAGCGHDPFRDKTDEVLAHCADFVGRLVSL
ncbi:MAG TPA: alpha/beta hydrolase [Stellaceae bacterium]|nr:alpha/beta hydrolase [Stellaceae bacterium]